MPESTRPPFTLSMLSAGRLLALAGGAALVLGAVFFLSLAFSRGWIGNEARVVLGLIGGAVLLVLSPVIYDRRQPTLALVLAAAGVATLELALYAARLYELVSPEVAMLATILVAAAAVVIAVRLDAQIVAVLGLAAVLFSPPLMQAPATLTTAGFLTIVVVATTAVSLARGWTWLPWLALVATGPQLLFWMMRGSPSVIVVGVGLTVYWLCIASAAMGEMWLRPHPRVLGSSTYLLLAVTLVSMLGAAGFDTTRQAGVWLLLLAGLQAASSAWFLVRRSRGDDHGQLLAALAFAVAGLGCMLAAPAWLIPVAWAAEAAILATLYHRLHHWYASWGAWGFTGLAVAAIAWAVYPLRELVMVGVRFPPFGEGLLPGIESALTVGSILAILGATGRWSLTSWSSRSGLTSMGALLLAYAAPFETQGLVLLLAWTVLAMACLMIASRRLASLLRRGHAVPDWLLLTGTLLGGIVVLWSVVGFPIPSGTVTLGSRALVERIAASGIPVVAAIVLVLWLRDRWWRGVTAGIALVLASVGILLTFGDVRLQFGDSGSAVADGSFIVLVAWAALGVLALVLDERPSLRLGSERDLVVDPYGHPLAFAALVPTSMVLIRLASRFLAGGVGGGLPATPFVDERTAATLLVVGFLALGAIAARTRLVRSMLIGLAAVLIGVLLPMELPMQWAVAGWCGMAVLAVVLTRSRTGIEYTGAWVLAAGFVLVSTVVTILQLAPPDRLFLEVTRVPPTSGPPNAATVALLSIAVAYAVGARLYRSALGREVLTLASGTTIVYLLSIGLADVFAMRIADGSSLEETAKQAQVALSILWASLGLALLGFGLVRDVALPRQAGLVLLGWATVKVFVYDLASLDIAYRVLSLIGLGVLLLVSAWAYQHGRHHGGPQAMSH